MRTDKRRKRRSATVGLLLIGLLAALLLLAACRGEAEEPNEGDIVEAFIGDLSASATASGQVLAGREAFISADVPGRVETVSVRVGDRVAGGDVLAQVETDDLALNVAIAEQSLRLSQAQLDDLLAGPTEAEVAAAEAAVASARAELADLLDGPSAEEVAAREADLAAAQANVQSAAGQLSQAQNAIKEADIAAAEAAVAAAEANLKSVEIQYTRNPEPDDIQANTALAQAREQLASAQSRLDLLLAGPDENQVGSAQAGVSAAAAQRDAAAAQLNKATADPTTAQRAAVEAQLAQAEAQLANLTDGATAEEVRAAEAEVAQAEVNLADAQAALDAATLRAPFAGVVTEVFFNEGEIANGPIIKLVDESSLRVVLEADEVDIGRLAVGQPATVVLEAWPEETIPSEVVAIAPSATTIPGSDLVIYEVQLSLTDVGLPILVGMTADADLITAEKEDVLLVPNRAINVDRATGTYSVNLIAGENVEEVPVTIGLRDSQYTEITSGLSEGDQLLIGGDLPVIDFQQGPPGQQD